MFRQELTDAGEHIDAVLIPQNAVLDVVIFDVLVLLAPGFAIGSVE